MKTNKNTIKKEIIDKIEKIENNTFLFPKSWSDLIDMIDEDWSYKTYHSGLIGERRYHVFEIYVSKQKVLEINFRGDSIIIQQDIDKKPVTIKDVNYYISAIFNELHSFKNHDEGKRNIRKEISEKQESIRKAQEQIKELKKRLLDSEKTA